MTSNDINFVDGLKINVYSPVDREVTVTMNEDPLNGTFVTGTTGTGYRTVRGYSYIFKTDPPGNDMIAKIAIPYDPAFLQNITINQADTFVGKLADDKKAWMVSTPRRTVQRAEFTASMGQITSLDGEYVILGREGTDTGNIFLPYGTGAQFSAKFAGGPGRQDVEFLDGLRFAVQSEFPLRMNVDLKFPVDEKDIPEGMISLNAYSWVVNTTGRVELTPPPIPTVPENGTVVPASNPANGTTVPLDSPPNALPAPANPAKPFTFASPRRRQLAPAAAPQPVAQPQPKDLGSPDLPQGNPAATSTPAAPDPDPAPPVNPPAIPGPPVPPIPGPPVAPPPIPAPPVPDPPAPAPAPPVAPPAGIVTAARIDFPLNLDAVRQVMRINPGQGDADPAAALSDPQLLSTFRFTVGRRPTGAEPNSPFDVVPMSTGPGLTPNTGNTGATGDAQSLQLIDGRLVFEGVTQLDGEYVILVPMDPATTAKVAAAKAGLIRANSATEIKPRTGVAMGTLAVATCFMFLL
ncbi:paired amphipathic helix protein sin3a protein [Venturia nashicola]|nr:paired amphipathic helix protein sin3a protein [Venturia nashicola]